MNKMNKIKDRMDTIGRRRRRRRRRQRRGGGGRGGGDVNNCIADMT